MPIRGNVDTRLAKLAAGTVDATILAAAGLIRLGQASKIAQILPPELMLPAVAQGIVGIERRADDARVAACCSRRWTVADPPRRRRRQRHLLATLDGSCKRR